MAKHTYTVEITAGGFDIHRDKVAMKTPAGIPMLLPTSELAEAITDEWRAQGDKPKPETMPMLQLACTALDIIPQKREMVISSLAAYGESDLLCHYADEPPDLAALQAKIWQPWLDWAEKRYGAKLIVGQGIMPVAQNKSAIETLRNALATYDNFFLTGLQQAIGVTGSVILGLALLEKQATPEQLFEASELDALYQMKKWGEDPVTIERHHSVKKELHQIKTWFLLLQKPTS